MINDFLYSFLFDALYLFCRSDLFDFVFICVFSFSCLSAVAYIIKYIFRGAF